MTRPAHMTAAAWEQWGRRESPAYRDGWRSGQVCRVPGDAEAVAHQIRGLVPDCDIHIFAIGRLEAIYAAAIGRDIQRKDTR